MRIGFVTEPSRVVVGREDRGHTIMDFGHQQALPENHGIRTEQEADCNHAVIMFWFGCDRASDR
jgi:hypothetical protein